jgi:quercetin dioxygenase-like cupin family protein
MKKHPIETLKAISVSLGKRKIPLLIVLGISAVALATPPSGIVLNQIVARGAALDDINEKITPSDNPDQSGENWRLKVQTNGATDFYVQHLVVGPGGHSGWHTHPGLLIGTVVSGSIDYYNGNCQKRSFTAGQVFTENSEVHAIINTGVVDADLSIAYLIKHDAARRSEATAPACAPSIGIP